MKGLRFILPLAIFGVLVFVLWRGLSLNPSEVPSPLINKAAPSFSLSRLENVDQTISRDDMLGRVWMLNVWASWCVACREEHPLLVEFSRSKSVPIIGLNYKDKRPAGMAWLARLGNPYDISAFDDEGKVGIDFGVYGVPETFVIDKRGIVRFKHIGALTPDVIRTRLQPLLKELNA